MLVLSAVYLLNKSLPQPWCNPLWLTGLKAPTKYPSVFPPRQAKGVGQLVLTSRLRCGVLTSSGGDVFHLTCPSQTPTPPRPPPTPDMGGGGRSKGDCSLVHWQGCKVSLSHGQDVKCPDLTLCCKLQVFLARWHWQKTSLNDGVGNTGLYVHRNHQGFLGTGKLGDREKKVVVFLYLTPTRYTVTTRMILH